MKIRCLINNWDNPGNHTDWALDYYSVDDTRELINLAGKFHLNITGISQLETKILNRLIMSAGGGCQIKQINTGTSDLLLIGNRSIFESVAEDLTRAELNVSPLGKAMQKSMANFLKQNCAIEANGFKLEPARKTVVMGILNVTPDSFSDGGKFFEIDEAVRHGKAMFEYGADIIDVGGESTRPGSEAVDEPEELSRVLPVVERLVDLGIPVSIDTSKSSVARSCIQAGAVMINDISGMHFDPEIAEVAAEYQTLLVLMHIKGKPRDMQSDTHYDDLMGEIIEYLYDSAESAKNAGVSENKIIIDPGIGFGKSFYQNLEIIGRLRELKVLGYPIMLGPSRKAFIGGITGKPAPERLFGTCGVCAYAASNGADILRVHDTEEIAQVVKTVDCITGKMPLDDAVNN